MSADNAIFILETPAAADGLFEYRVMHGGVSQVDYFLTEEDHKGLFEYFSRAHVYHVRIDADVQACGLLDCFWTEYGIVDISAPLEFKCQQE